MSNREELKALIDQLPEENLFHVEAMLRFHLSPPKPRPEIEALRRRVDEYRSQVLRRFQETRKPGTYGIGSMGSAGSFGEYKGRSFGRRSFHYWDDKALVYQSIQHLDGHEIEVVERLSVT